MTSRGRVALVFVLFSTACGGAARPKESTAPEAAAPGLHSTEDSGEPATVTASAPAAAPAPADEAPATTKDRDQSLSEAISEFDRARLELSQLLGRDLGQSEGAPTGGAAPPPREPSRSRPASDKAASSRAEAEEPKAKPLKKGDDGCANVCRAFESLTRSAAAVCRLDDGERCRRATAVVTVAQDDAGVKACACKK